MGFQAELRAAVANVHAREQRLQELVAQDVFNSVRDGSTITGAPGQPVDTGELYKSWKKRKVGRREWLIESDSPYAGVIEENRRGAKLRSSVGGFHSVKLTRLGYSRLVAYRAARLDGPATSPTLGRNAQPRDKRGRFTWGDKTSVRVRRGG